MPIYAYIIVIVLAAALIGYGVYSFVQTTKRKKKYEEDIKTAYSYSPEELESIKLETYKTKIAYWLNVLEMHTADSNITKILKVKKALINDYNELNNKLAEVNLISKEQSSDPVIAYHPQYFSRTRVYFNGLTCRMVMPFIGEDGFYYAIVFISTADKLGYEFTKENLNQFLDDTFEVRLISYATDKFTNRKVEPVEYTPYYIPKMALSESYLIKPWYNETEFYDT